MDTNITEQHGGFYYEIIFKKLSQTYQGYCFGWHCLCYDEVLPVMPWGRTQDPFKNRVITHHMKKENPVTYDSLLEIPASEQLLPWNTVL